jgi:hypothetical protein
VYSPAALAAQVIKAVTPTTTLSVDTAQRVAKHSAYILVLTPRTAKPTKTPDSTVRRVTIAIDSKTFVPLRVQIFGSPSTPALSVGFSKVRFTRPAASVFAFHKPAGATVSSNPLTADRHGRHGDRHAVRTPGARIKPGTAAPSGTAPTGHHQKVIGSGWTTVIETDSSAFQGAGSGLIDRATTSVPGLPGARALHTTLLNVLMLSDGRVFAGAVSPFYLQHVAASTPN